VVRHFIALLQSCRFGGAVECALKCGGRAEILHFPATRTDKVMVMAEECLCELETTMVIGSGDSVDDSKFDERGDDSICAALDETWNEQ
jgi:hypothetical protein